MKTIKNPIYTVDLVPEKLHQCRKYRKYKVVDIAAALDIHHQTIRRWERGSFPISAPQLAAFANLMEIDINFFFLDDMKLADADCRKAKKVKTVTLLDQVDSLKDYIENLERFDELLFFIKQNKEIKELNAKLMNLPAHLRRRIMDKLDGIFIGLTEDLTPDDKEETVSDEAVIPFGGHIKGETVVDNDDCIGKTIRVPVSMVKKPGQYLALKVMDNSTQSLGAKQGDIILFRVNQTPREGEIGAVLNNKVIYIKHMAIKTSVIDLQDIGDTDNRKRIKKRESKILGVLAGILGDE